MLREQYRISWLQVPIFSFMVGTNKTIWFFYIFQYFEFFSIFFTVKKSKPWKLRRLQTAMRHCVILVFRVNCDNNLNRDFHLCLLPPVYIDHYPWMVTPHCTQVILSPMYARLGVSLVACVRVWSFVGQVYIMWSSTLLLKIKEENKLNHDEKKSVVHLWSIFYCIPKLSMLSDLPHGLLLCWLHILLKTFQVNLRL